MAVTGKVILKVKSGPGTLIGEVEADIIDDAVSFKGLKFDQPGDYVVSVTSTSTFVEFSEFSVKILPEEISLEQPQKNSQEEEKKPEEKPKPIITQVDQPKVDLPPMTFDNTKSERDDKLVASQIGLTPFINYMGSPINDRDIKMLILSHDGIIPTIDFMFDDSNGLIKSVGMPQDDTKFEFFLNSRSPNIKSIHIKFKVEEFTTIKNGSYRIYGTLDISELYRIKYQPYTGTSYEVLREISKELKLGFNSNITNTDDKMIWRNVGDTQYEFIDSIIQHSYISDKSFMVGFIDYYYCFNYVDVEKEMNRDVSKDKFIDTSGYDDGKLKDTEKILSLQLNSDKALNASSLFIVEKNFENNSTALSLEKGYKTKTKYYDKSKKEFLVFDVDATTSDQSNTMVLKGANGDKEAFENNVTTQYSGKIDTDNVHKNYNYALTQNKINLDEINKIILVVDIPNPNYSLYLFQKVNVVIVNDGVSPVDPQRIQWRKSGDYIISNIDYNWDGKSLKQEVRLMRKELGKDPAEVKEGPPPAEKSAADVKNPNNENPSDAPITDAKGNPFELENPIPLPNDKFKVGEVYTIEASGPVRYLANITNVLANGIEVTAKLSLIQKLDDGTYRQNPLEGDYLFNVEKVGFMNSQNLGEVVIIGTGEVYDNVQNTENEDTLDDEFAPESEFQGEEEQAIILQKTDDFIVVNSETTNNIKGVDPEVYNESLSTDTESKYPIDKNTDANIKKIISICKNRGITNKYAIAAVLAICKKESGFIPKGETSYAGTKAVKIKKIFSKFRKYSDAEVDVIKKNPRQFFDIIYGGKYGNAANEGFKYRGRGFNQITFKGNYESYKKLTGHDIVNDPDLLNTANVAGACLAEYFKSNFKSAPSGIKSKYNFSSINSFTNLDDAIGAFYHANAGWGNSYSDIVADPTGGRATAFKYAGPLYNTYAKSL